MDILLPGLELQRDRNDEQREIECLIRLGRIYLRLKEYHKAVYYCELLLEKQEAVPSPYRNEIYRNLSICYRAFGKYDDAMKYLKMDSVTS